MTDLLKEQFHYVYLASKSPRRRAILKKMGVRFELIVFSRATGVELNEEPLKNEEINEYSERITYEKLELGWNAVNDRKLLPSPVLVADTCIGFQGQIIGKPSNLDDAFNILTKLSGNTHSVYTTIAIQFGDTREVISTNQKSNLENYYQMKYVNIFLSVNLLIKQEHTQFKIEVKCLLMKLMELFKYYWSSYSNNFKSSK